MRITKLNKTSKGDNFCIVKVSPVNGYIMISKDGILFDKTNVESYIDEHTKRNKIKDFLKNINVVNESVCFLDIEKPYIFFGPDGIVEYYIKLINNNAYLVKTDLQENLINKSEEQINREELYKLISPKDNENVLYVDKLLKVLNSSDELFNNYKQIYLNNSPLYALRTIDLESSFYEYNFNDINDDKVLLKTNEYELGYTKKMEMKLKK